MKKRIICYLLPIFIICTCLVACEKKESNIYEKINSISRQIDGLEISKKVNMLLTKDTALIGLDLMDNNLNIDAKNDLKNRIKQIVLKNDKNIKNIFISNDVNVNIKINNIMRNLNKGKNIDIESEIKNIVNKFIANI